MDVNANFDQRVVVHSELIDWVDSPIAGVQRRMLDRIGDEVARERYADEFSARLTLISDNGDSIHAKLDAFVKLFQDVVVEDKFCLCGMMAAEIDSLSDENRQQLARYFRSTEDWLVQTLKGARIDSIKPQTLARLILSGLEGAILIDRVTGGTDRIKAQRTLIRHMVPK